MNKNRFALRAGAIALTGALALSTTQYEQEIGRAHV